MVNKQLKYSQIKLINQAFNLLLWIVKCLFSMAMMLRGLLNKLHWNLMKLFKLLDILLIALMKKF